MINGVQEDDAGDYSCIASNKAGNLSRPFAVRLSGPPVIDKGEEEMDVTIGSSISLTCNVISGTGNISVSWLIDGKPVENGQYSPTVQVRVLVAFLETSGLQIVDRRVQVTDARVSDSGKYICVVKNEAGEARKTFDLSVLGNHRLSLL